MIHTIRILTAVAIVLGSFACKSKEQPPVKAREAKTIVPAKR